MMPNNATIWTAVQALQSWMATAKSQIATLQADVAALKAGGGGSVDLGPLTAKVDTLQATVTALQNKECVNQPDIDALKAALLANTAADAVEKAAQDVIETDHAAP